MAEILISSSALILVLAILRLILRDKISARLQYALWLLVLIRLLVPVSLFRSPVSIAEAAAPAVERVETLTEQALYVRDKPVIVYTPRLYTFSYDYKDFSYGGLKPDVLSVGFIARMIWHGGMIAMAGYFIFLNLRLAWRLRESRVPYGKANRLFVYVAAGIPSPCLFGLFRPAIYLTEQAASDPAQTRQIAAHEETHFRHGDLLWALLRSACLVIWWFNPLVWLAAALSRRDCELACDEGTIKALGEDARFDYGRTLVGMAKVGARPSDLLCGATTMTTGRRSLKERVARIAQARKMSVSVAVAAVLIAALAVGCTFSGGTEDSTEPEAAVKVSASATDSDAAPTDGETASEEEPAGPLFLPEPEDGAVEAMPYDRAYWEEVDRELADFVYPADIEVFFEPAFAFDEELPEDDIFGPRTLEDYIYGTDSWQFRYDGELMANDPAATIKVYGADGRILWIMEDADALMIEEADGSVTWADYSGNPVDCADMIRHLLPWARGEYPAEEQLLAEAVRDQERITAITAELGHYGFPGMTEYHISASDILYDSGVVYNLPEWASGRQGINGKRVYAAYGTETENIDLEYARYYNSTSTALTNSAEFENARAYYGDVMIPTGTGGLQVNGYDAFAYTISPYDIPALVWYDTDAELIFHLTEYTVGTDPRGPSIAELISLAETVSPQ